MGRKRILPMLSFHGQGLLLLAAVSSPHRKSVRRSCAPSFSAHVRLGEHGAPVTGRGLQSSLPPHCDADELREGCHPTWFRKACLMRLRRIRLLLLVVVAALPKQPSEEPFFLLLLLVRRRR